MSRQRELIPLNPGDILRHERQKNGLTLQQLAAKLKIRSSILASIESGETQSIPSVYLHGYIRSYARELGLHPDEIEDRISNAEGSDPGLQTVFTVSPARGSADRWLKATSYAVASVLVAALVWQFTHEAVRFSQGESQSASSTAFNDEEHSSDTVDHAPPRPANSHLNASIASIEALKENSQSSDVPSAEQAWAAIDKPMEISTVEQPGFHSLLISSSGDSWIEITDARGKILERDLIRAGNSRQYSGPAPFRILLGRASAIDLHLDGEPVDLAPHTRGNVARMTLGQNLTAESDLRPDSGRD
jgi:cytoskeleton protein RodZ